MYRNYDKNIDSLSTYMKLEINIYDKVLKLLNYH